MQSLIKDLNRLRHADLPIRRRCSTISSRLRSLLFAAPQIEIFTEALALHVAALSRKCWEAAATLPEPVTIQLALVLEELKIWKGGPFTVGCHTHIYGRMRQTSVGEQQCTNR